MPLKRLAVILAVFALGVACGGYFFARSLPRSFLAVGDCESRCYKLNELAGLLTSAAILRAPSAIPNVELESDTCLAIRYPRSKPKAKASIHYVLFPKRDAKNIASLTPADAPFVLGCLALARELVVRDKLQAYRLITNGPDFQEITYLHFHLVTE
ncbi:MAG: hypothetical protein ACXWCU_12215 [Caldimonas sp.]